MLLIFFQFLFVFPTCYSIDPELDLPVYLRGFQWKNVQEELRKDFTLSNAVRPISYDIHLNVTVRGYEGAERSTFEGIANITLNITSPTEQIELHSIGLSINQVVFVSESDSVVTATVIGKIDVNRERETISFPTPAEIEPSDHVYVLIHYNGTSGMKGEGLFESWTDRENKRKPELPTISLVTNCEPVGARLWFPCFDEPDKKAKFRMVVEHPMELNAYSNTPGSSIVSRNGRMLTSFKQTVPLPTYVVALAITAQSSSSMKHRDMEIRAIGRYSESVLRTLNKALTRVESIAALRNATFFPEKTDLLIVDDFFTGAMENPGLIISTPEMTNLGTLVHEFIHMYFGNLVTLRSWNQIWINEAFAVFFALPSTGKNYEYIGGKISLHETAIHANFTYIKSNFLKNHYTYNYWINYHKSGALISLASKVIGKEEFETAMDKYLRENEYENGDSEMLIDYLSGTNSEAREFLTSFIYQPGTPLVTWSRENELVKIRQRRFLRTDAFDDELRDDITRWTIPLYYSINGVEHLIIFPSHSDVLAIETPVNSTFKIDEEYPYLYLVAEDREFGESGEVSGTTGKNDEVLGEAIRDPFWRLKRTRRSPDPFRNWRSVDAFCGRRGGNSSRVDWFNEYLRLGDVARIFCDGTLRNEQEAKRFLREFLLGEGLPIRSSDESTLVDLLNTLYPGILTDFIVKNHEKIDGLSSGVLHLADAAFKEEKGGIEKLRSVIRANPAFAANFYHFVTRTLEGHYISQHMGNIF